LLDTHSFLWFVFDDPKLSAKVLIQDPANQALLSPAAYWEIAIKVAAGKLNLHAPYLTFVQGQLAANRIGILPIEPRHAAALIGLPFHHKDPFDRMLIAQAISEGIPVVTADAAFAAYPVAVLW
jgi:PIN domain nuclease of toxin-antitoxin system